MGGTLVERGEAQSTTSIKNYNFSLRIFSVLIKIIKNYYEFFYKFLLYKLLYKCYVKY